MNVSIDTMKKPVIVQEDPWLDPYSEIIQKRYEAALNRIKELSAISGSLSSFASGHLFYGLHRTEAGWIFREYAPGATQIFLLGDFNEWKKNASYELHLSPDGNWEIQLPENSMEYGQRFKLLIYWKGAEGYRLPSYAFRCVQDDTTKVFDAQVWSTGTYKWQSPYPFKTPDHPIIYEAHIGMATESQRVGSYTEFRRTSFLVSGKPGIIQFS
jgi:1,4-alpha-glucan branching enzyme